MECSGISIEGWKEISIERYLEDYCNMSYRKFLKKKLRRTFYQDAYSDITYYYDDKNKLIVHDRMYIGD